MAISWVVEAKPQGLHKKTFGQSKMGIILCALQSLSCVAGAFGYSSGLIWSVFLKDESFSVFWVRPQSFGHVWSSEKQQPPNTQRRSAAYMLSEHSVALQTQLRFPPSGLFPSNCTWCHISRKHSSSMFHRYCLAFVSSSYVCQQFLSLLLPPLPLSLSSLALLHFHASRSVQ